MRVGVRGDEVDEQFSVAVGTARLTERYGLGRRVSDEALAAALDGIATELDCLDARPSPDSLVGMGGALTNIAAVHHGLAALRFSRRSLAGSLPPRPVVRHPEVAHDCRVTVSIFVRRRSEAIAAEVGSKEAVGESRKVGRPRQRSVVATVAVRARDKPQVDQ